MPAADFRTARADAAASDDDDSTKSTIVDGFHYFPKLVVDPTSNASVIRAVLRLFGLNSNENNDESNDSIACTCTPVTGGTTNQLFRVSKLPTISSSSSSSPSSVLVRVFGAEGLIDRDDETAAYIVLARQGVGPPYWGRFANGRIEGWLDGMRALETSELESNSQAIAVQLGRLHDGIDLARDMPGVKTEPTLWTQLDEWYAPAVKATFRTEHDTQRAQSQLGLAALADELAWLKAQAPTNPNEAPVAFCHNDLLAANIMVSNDDNNDDSSSGKERRIQLIDFEYGGVNFIAFDIANHFNEFAGGPPDTPTPDYTLLPGPDRQQAFCEAYCKARQSSSITMTPHDLYQQVQIFILINHLYWGLWGVNQASIEGTEEFDYMQYAIARFQQYYVAKAEYLQNENSK